MKFAPDLSVSAAPRRYDGTVAQLPAAEGGIETVISQGGKFYRVHTFLTSGALTVTDGGAADVLVVGPGGPGGSTAGFTACGGGAGGDVIPAQLILEVGEHAITIGTSASPSVNPPPELGDATTALGLTALPGGRGGGRATTTAGQESAPTEGGGGHGMVNLAGINPDSFVGAVHTTSGKGGDGFEESTTGNPNRSGGGARGAGGDGQDADIDGGGDGGPGIASDIDGTLRIYGRGGGGGSRRGTAGAPNGTTGLNDGGAGENPGDGGGGASADGSGTHLGGPGADGIVIIRYEISEADYLEAA